MLASPCIIKITFCMKNICVALNAFAVDWLIAFTKEHRIMRKCNSKNNYNNKIQQKTWIFAHSPRFLTMVYALLLFFFGVCMFFIAMSNDLKCYKNIHKHYMI